MFNTKAIVSKLVDYFDKRPESNFSKLFRILSSELERVQEVNNTVRAWRSIEQAEGSSLDAIGTDVRVTRGSATDEVYRILIKAKIARNLSDSTINGVINALALTLNTAPSEIRISEAWTDPDKPSDNAIKIHEIPMWRVIQAGMDEKSFITVIQQIVGSGIRIDGLELTGTFEFGDISEANVLAPQQGFGDKDNTEIGGYFGSIYEKDK